MAICLLAEVTPLGKSALETGTHVTAGAASGAGEAPAIISQIKAVVPTDFLHRSFICPGCAPKSALRFSGIATGPTGAAGFFKSMPALSTMLAASGGSSLAMPSTYAPDFVSSVSSAVSFSCMMAVSSVPPPAALLAAVSNALMAVVTEASVGLGVGKLALPVMDGQ